MNWMNFTPANDFWKAWQEGIQKNNATQTGTEAMKNFWQQQESFWKKGLEQIGQAYGQPSGQQQWQDLQNQFMNQWGKMTQDMMNQNGRMSWDQPSETFRKFADQTEQWYIGAFRDKLPENLRPHFQHYVDLYKLFVTQWDNIQGMVRAGLTEPGHVWQWFDPNQYGQAIGKIMGFKPITDVNLLVRQVNQYFDAMQKAILRSYPDAETKFMDMQEAMTNWSDRQFMEGLPFMQSIQELMKQQLEPYFHMAGNDAQGEISRKLKDLHFTYLSYLQHAWQMQRMVISSSALVLPEMLQQARNEWNEKQQMPVFDTFFRQYMDKLENAIVDVMHTEEYMEVQNEVMRAGSMSKQIMDGITQMIVQEWPFLTKAEADNLIRETADLKRKVRELESLVKKLTGPKANGTKSSADVTETIDSASFASTLLKQVGEGAGANDDLTEIKGIGEKLADILKGLGVRTFDQVARMDDNTYELVDALLPAFKGRAKRDQWAEQAKKRIKALSSTK